MPATGAQAPAPGGKIAPSEPAVALLDCDPELGEGLSAEAEAQARTSVLADVRRYPRGDWEVDLGDFDGQTSIGLLAALSRRVMNRLHWLAFHLAVCGLRRIDDRVLLVLWHYADRWGTVTGEGVRLDVPHTHELLASVIGARRPSVTVAVQRLSARKRVYAMPRSCWLLLGEPPAELRGLHERTR